MGNIAEYIQRYSVDWTVGYKDEYMETLEHIELQLKGVIKPFSARTVKPQRDIMVLYCAEVESDMHWQYLHYSSEQKHPTGPEPRSGQLCVLVFYYL